MASRRQLTKIQSRKETRAIWVFVMILVLIFALAAYGYFTGAWEPPPS
jgi:hypothetical protein